ncbi:lysylphosphatidylglycerol synthase domain-containing protein [Pseudomonas chlororaphis]|uniref:lysylphosphatidylglycerol synthase domain-containing protein n=1 Tax=Pseudomonas chlororaphis TaxID=587753 RepID=UPI0023651B4A|nr:lysylphosphatidylglycerol synthase domain-containing protein [Pseudomonas chlororaphis]WDH21143.1 hypothetical protein PUP50_24530 [Pseudomonas chlororaphis]
MSKSLRLYYGLLLVVVIGWLWLRAPDIASFGRETQWAGLVGITVLYLGSHVLRMLRLVLLTLDDRNKAFPLVAAHTLTAFPSSFLPFKLGEVLRLGAFFQVFEHRQKALAVWLSERFGDVVVISMFIMGLYLFDVQVVPAMRTIFVLFVLASGLSLLGFFAVAKIFVYLNRHLVLTSHTSRGLVILRASQILRRLEIAIYKSIEGRIAGFLLLSVLIWSIEILALSLFINQLEIGDPDLAALFTSGLLASLPGAGGEANAFGLYQSLGLVVLTLVFLLVVSLSARSKLLRTRDV